MTRPETGERGADDPLELPDLDEVDGPRLVLAPRTWVSLLTIAAIALGFVYDYAVLPARQGIVFGWDLVIHEWLFVCSLSVFCTHVLVPLARNRELTRHYWRRLRSNPIGLWSFLYLVGFFLVGMIGPAVVGVPQTTTLQPSYQPPVGIGVDSRFVSTCLGTVAGGACHGTLAYPLGTDGNGRDVVVVVTNAMRLALEVGFISGMLLVPIATLVGTVAAEFGGRVDEVLMRFVDLQQVVPAFFVYIVAQFVLAPTLTLLLLVFGVLSWGAIARMVREEARQRREREYVRAVESAGGSRLWIIRRHIVPNVTNTIIPAVTLQIPTLILIEAGVSFLALGDPTVSSFGWAISAGLTATEFPMYWWISTVPAIVLIVSVTALNLFGDALGDVLDPRRDG